MSNIINLISYILTKHFKYIVVLKIISVFLFVKRYKNLLKKTNK